MKYNIKITTSIMLDNTLSFEVKISLLPYPIFSFKVHAIYNFSYVYYYRKIFIESYLFKIYVIFEIYQTSFLYAHGINK